MLGGGQPLNKAFTLIELLAVIVILAIIALIAMPIILGIIKDTKKEADKRSVEMYYKALENAIAQQQLDGSKPLIGTFETKNGKEILLNGQPILTVDYDGPEIMVERIDIYEDGSVYIQGIKSKSDNKPLANSVGTKQHYIDGEEVYIDITTGKSCTNYHVDNSITGYNGLTTTKTTNNQNSCLKFYSFLDDGSDKINLLLDHNTTAKVAWNSSGSNILGPSEIINQLKTDTNEWKGTITPANYEYKGTERPYTIKYNTEEYKYKARLITAQEIAQITGADKEDTLNFKEESSIKWYYFHNLTQDQTTGQGNVCKTGGCKYKWLYDRTATNCTNYGCSNDSVGLVYGYWTSSADASRSDYAWFVIYYGRMSRDCYVNPTDGFGVRPVIEVSKSNL